MFLFEKRLKWKKYAISSSLLPKSSWSFKNEKSSYNTSTPKSNIWNFWNKWSKWLAFLLWNDKNCWDALSVILIRMLASSMWLKFNQMFSSCGLIRSKSISNSSNESREQARFHLAYCIHDVNRSVKLCE